MPVEQQPYAIPRYRSQDAVWYHVLHGNVPFHQIDFMYCPEVPQGPLTATHFSHLSRVIKYIEPQPGARYAFSIANLSRDDTHFEPGRSGIGLVLGLRIEGAVDHAGRKNPPFTHAIAAVGREMTYAALLESATTFFRHILSEAEVERATVEFYVRYLARYVEDPEQVPAVLREYTAGFDDLPCPPRSGLGWAWKVEDDAEFKRVVILYDETDLFSTVAHCAAKIAAVLYQSNIRWTQITNGGERDLPGGVTVRFLMRRNAVASDDARRLVLSIDDVPDGDADIAGSLFGARPVEEAKPDRLGWREKLAHQRWRTGGDVADGGGGEGRYSIPSGFAASPTEVGHAFRAEEMTRVANLSPLDAAPPSNSLELIAADELPTRRVAALSEDDVDSVYSTGTGTSVQHQPPSARRSGLPSPPDVFGAGPPVVVPPAWQHGLPGLPATSRRSGGHPVRWVGAGLGALALGAVFVYAWPASKPAPEEGRFEVSTVQPAASSTEASAGSPIQSVSGGEGGARPVPEAVGSTGGHGAESSVQSAPAVVKSAGTKVKTPKPRGQGTSSAVKEQPRTEPSSTVKDPPKDSVAPSRVFDTPPLFK